MHAHTIFRQKNAPDQAGARDYMQGRVLLLLYGFLENVR